MHVWAHFNVLVQIIFHDIENVRVVGIFSINILFGPNFIRSSATMIKLDSGFILITARA